MQQPNAPTAPLAQHTSSPIITNTPPHQSQTTPKIGQPRLVKPAQMWQPITIPHKPLIQSMYYRISQIITEMLDRIKYMFQIYGIQSCIHAYHSAIFKLIVPVELMSYVWYGQHQSEAHFRQDAMDILFASNADNNTDVNTINRKSNNYFDQLRAIPQKHKIDLFDLIPSSKTPSHRHTSQQVTNDQPRNQSEQAYDNYSDEKQESDSFGQRSQYKRSKKFVLDQEAEEKLCEWVRYQAMNFTMPTVRELAMKAKSLANTNKFRASTGWCHHFFIRHPTIRKYIKRSTTGPRVEQPIKTVQQQPEQPEYPPFKYTKLEKDANFLRFSEKQQAEEQYEETEARSQFVSEQQYSGNQDESHCVNQIKQWSRPASNKFKSVWYDGHRGRRADEGYQHYFKGN